MPDALTGAAVMLPRSAIRRDGGTQPRAALNEQVIADYAEALERGEPFPPATVFYDGADYWLADGFHRDGAHERLGRDEMPCDVRAGTRRDAVLFACGANEAHGLRRSNEDKRRAVLILINDAEWCQWSDREIARRANVGHPLVAEMRRLTGRTSSERTYVTRHGTVATMEPAAAKRAADIATIRSLPVGALYDVIAEQRARKTALKRERRDEKERELAEKIAGGNAALLAAGAAGLRYPVILADPEWRFEPWSRETGMDRAPENHYPTTPTQVIASRPVGQIAAADCVLFLWATAPMLYAAYEVMTGWGFAYKTHCIWAKRRPGKARGPGYWFTGEHEILLLGTRGDPPAPAPGTQWPSFFIADIGAHSAKPDRAYELIESYFPNLPKIELNARRARAGWESWGAEAPEGAVA